MEKICPNCGNKLKENETKCPYCNNEFEEVEELDDLPLTRDYRELKDELKEELNKIEGKYCIKCGSLLKADEKFCPKCGKKVNDSNNKENVNDPNNKENVNFETYNKKQNTKTSNELYIFLAIIVGVFLVAGLYNFTNIFGGKISRFEKSLVEDGWTRDSSNKHILSKGDDGTIISYNTEEGTLTGTTSTSVVKINFITNVCYMDASGVKTEYDLTNDKMLSCSYTDKLLETTMCSTIETTIRTGCYSVKYSNDDLLEKYDMEVNDFK